MSLSDFYGVRLVASEIVSDLNSGKTVFVQFPDDATKVLWEDPIRRACEAALNVDGDSQSFEFFRIGRDGRGPMDLIEQLDLSAPCESESGSVTLDTELIYKFLKAYGRDPVAISVDCSFKESTEWRDFLVKVTSCQKSLGSDEESRFLLFFSEGLELPTGLVPTSVSKFQFWNPIRWEEMRLEAHRALAGVRSGARRAWMVATYVGGANLCPATLTRLCYEQPRALDQVLELASASAQSNGHVPKIAEREDSLEAGADSVWKLPTERFESWGTLGVITETLERGPYRLLSRIPPDDRDRVLRYQIWQEQASGLLPLVVQVSRKSNEILDHWLRPNWRESLGQWANVDAQETYDLEVTKVIEFIESSSTDHLKETPFRLLKTLRHIRNKLAHMEPIELQRIEEAWELFIRTSSFS